MSVYLIVLVVVTWRLALPTPHPSPPWRPELALLHDASRHAGGRPYVGVAGDGGLALAGNQQALLILGPPRSGKTTSLIVPNVLTAPGPVVATSTKPDVLHATWPTRSTIASWSPGPPGRCWVFDPTGTASVEGIAMVRWSPVDAARTWDDSLVVARAMVRAARPQSHSGESGHWTERAETLLAPLLYAAAVSRTNMRAVTGWVLRRELGPAQAALSGPEHRLASDILTGLAATEEREMSGIWSTAAGVLAAYRAEAALASATDTNFDPAALVHTRDTVYICAPSRQQDLVAPIVVAFLEQARAGAYAAAATGRLTQPLTFVLDELANIAPLPDLPALVSEGGGQGVITIAALQDLAQARDRWGRVADGFLSLFGAKVVLPGIGDLSTLELVSRLGGEVDVPTRSVSSGPWWSAAGQRGRSETWSVRRQRILPVDAVSHLPRGQALLLDGPRPPELVRTVPWWDIGLLHPRSHREVTPAGVAVPEVGTGPGERGGRRRRLGWGR